jgi:hypothetical protein
MPVFHSPIEFEASLGTRRDGAPALASPGHGQSDDILRRHGLTSVASLLCPT